MPRAVIDPAPDVAPLDVLVITASVGAGHNSVAGTLVEAIGEAAPEASVECIDAMEYTPRLFRAYYAGGFALGMSRFKRAYGLIFRLTNRPQRPGRGWLESGRLLLERWCTKRLRQYVRERKPRVVLHVHFLAPPQIARMMRREEFATHQLVVVTDICMHRLWYSEGVRHWFVPADMSAATLMRWGMDPRDITVSGIPVHPKWTAPGDRGALCREWGLPADRPVVALSGGTDFSCGPVVRIAGDVLAKCPQAHLVVLTGRNDSIRRKLARLPEAGERLSVIPFTPRINELVSVSSLMVTKAGGITTAECLAAGTPMLLLRPVPGHEAGNARYLADKGAAVIVRRNRDVGIETARILGDPERLAALSRGARARYNPGRETVISYVKEILAEATDPCV